MLLQRGASAGLNRGRGADMSRSFKKTPIYKDGGYQSDGKRIANRKVRRAPNVTFSTGKRKLYKKIYETWDINDYVIRWTRRDAEKIGRLKEWERCCHRK